MMLDDATDLARLAAENAELQNIRTLLMMALAVATGRPHSRKEVVKDALMAQGPVTLATEHATAVAALKARCKVMDGWLDELLADVKFTTDSHTFLGFTTDIGEKRDRIRAARKALGNG